MQWLASLSVHLLVDLFEPTQTRFVRAGEAIVEVDNCVVLLHILVQSMEEISAIQGRGLDTVNPHDCTCTLIPSSHDKQCCVLIVACLVNQEM